METGPDRSDGGTPSSQRTEAELGGSTAVRIALGLLIFFIGLLVLWVLWPLISG